MYNDAVSRLKKFPDLRFVPKFVSKQERLFQLAFYLN